MTFINDDKLTATVIKVHTVGSGLAGGGMNQLNMRPTTGSFDVT
jgi:hypothetical protein